MGRDVTDQEVEDLLDELLPHVLRALGFEDQLGVSLEFTQFTRDGYWDVDDVLRPIYEEAGEAVGREFKYPGDE